MKGDRVTVTTSATKIADAAIAGGVRGVAALVRNRGATPVFLGGADVVQARSYQLDAGEEVSVPVSEIDETWGLVGTGTAIVHVLYSQDG